MTDTRLRNLERRFQATGSVQDEAAWITERLRVGELARDQVELAAWLGHAAALTTVSLAVIVLGLRVPDHLVVWMEFLVGVVLALLGARMIWRCRRGAVLHVHSHRHGITNHFHPHVHPAGVDPDHMSHHQLPASSRALIGSAGKVPFLVGLLHGMAGSAALTVVILTAIPGTAARLGYVLLFAIGSVLGMTAMSALVGLPFATGRWSGVGAQRTLRLVAGSLSLGLGLLLMMGLAPDLGI